MHRVLITKQIDLEQEALAYDYGLDITEQSFIKVTYKYDTVFIPEATAWIITSENAAKYLAIHFSDFPENVIPKVIYSIGKTSAAPIKHLGIRIKTPNYATADNLADMILQDNVDSAVFFCGNLRKDTIKNRLEEEVDLVEKQVYKTEFLDIKMDMSQFEGVAFFSPSGVYAFAQSNELTDQVVVAIGSTTRQAVAECFNIRAGIAGKATVEDVLFALKEDLNS